MPDDKNVNGQQLTVQDIMPEAPENISTCGGMRPCKFFKRNPANLQQTWCGRFPPTIQMIMSPQGPGQATLYPAVPANFPACGEFKPKIK